MPIWVLILSFLLAATISVIVVALAIARSASTPPQIIFDAEESIEYTAQALPDSVTSSISYTDLQRALRLHLEWLQAFHWSPAGASKSPIVFDENEPIDYIVQRSKVIGLTLNRSELESVVRAHYDYLGAIGAIHTQDKAVTEADLRSVEELTE